MSESERPTSRLAEFVAALSPGAIPDDTRERALALIIDAIGCALAARHGEETVEFGKFARTTLGPGSSTVIGEAAPTAMTGAVLLNAFRITAVTLCDVYTPAHCHITPEVLPPALAIAEARNASGADLLLAMIAGLEIATRIASGIRYRDFRARGWHAPGVIGPFGGAAAVSSLLHLSATQTRAALALAGSQSSGTWAAWGTPTVKFHQARGAMSGLLAGLLAAEDFRGSDEILTHPDGGIFQTYSNGGDAAGVTADLGSRWELAEISMRPSPGATPMQPVITALSRVLAARAAGADEIERLALSVPPAVYSAHERFGMPAGTFEALLSIRYAAAAIITDGEAWLPQFERDRYADPKLRHFLEKIELIPDETLARDGGEAAMFLNDGSHQRARVDFAHGHPRDPLTSAEVDSKFLRLAEDSMRAAAAQELLERLHGLATARSLGPILALLRSSDLT